MRCIFRPGVLAPVLLALFAIAVFAQGGGPMKPDTPALRVGTFNLWHGLDPVGTWKFREYETPERREERLRVFLDGAKRLDRDVWFLQEANMLPGIARRIARELNMDEVHQVDNCGVKVLQGPPVNFRSGLVILARKELGLKKIEGVKLSGPFGLCGDWFGVQLEEFRYGLIAAIDWDGGRVALVNAHLHHGPEADEEFRADIHALVERGEIGPDNEERIVDSLKGTTRRRIGELDTLFAALKKHGLDAAPVVLGGDLNCSPDSEEIASLLDRGFVDTTGPFDPKTGAYTWHLEDNPNARFALDFTPPVVFENDAVKAAVKAASTKTRRLDYILFRHPDGAWRANRAGRIFDEPVNGTFASDHFGIAAAIEPVN